MGDVTWTSQMEQSLGDFCGICRARPHLIPEEFYVDLSHSPFILIIVSRAIEPIFMEEGHMHFEEIQCKHALSFVVYMGLS